MGGELLIAAVLVTAPALGAGAARDLPDNTLPGQPFTVTITLDVPPGTSVAAAEDAPPPGWNVSNISNGGSFDVQTGKVKWGLFFAPSIPNSLTYTVVAGSSSPCFSGTVTYDQGDFPIGGDACTVTIPALSTWGGLILILSMLTAGTVLVRRVA